MCKKLILFIALLNWSSLSYAFNIKKTKIHVLVPLAGFSNPSMQFSDSDPAQITNNFLFGGSFSIQLFQSISLDVSGTRFWPNYVINSKKVLNAEGQEMSTPTLTNTTHLFDLVVKKNVYAFTPYTTLYFKGGVWCLNTAENAAYEEQTEIAEHNTQPICFNHVGYGVAIGPGINWRFAPRALPSASADFSALLYIPTPTMDILGTNTISGMFPVIKGGVSWNIR